MLEQMAGGRLCLLLSLSTNQNHVYSKRAEALLKVCGVCLQWDFQVCISKWFKATVPTVLASVQISFKDALFWFIERSHRKCKQAVQWVVTLTLHPPIDCILQLVWKYFYFLRVFVSYFWTYRIFTLSQADFVTNANKTKFGMGNVKEGTLTNVYENETDLTCFTCCS